MTVSSGCTSSGTAAMAEHVFGELAATSSPSLTTAITRPSRAHLLQVAEGLLVVTVVRHHHHDRHVLVDSAMFFLLLSHRDLPQSCRKRCVNQRAYHRQPCRAVCYPSACRLAGAPAGRLMETYELFEIFIARPFQFCRLPAHSARRSRPLLLSLSRLVVAQHAQGHGHRGDALAGRRQFSGSLPTSRWFSRGEGDARRRGRLTLRNISNTVIKKRRGNPPTANRIPCTNAIFFAEPARQWRRLLRRPPRRRRPLQSRRSRPPNWPG